MPIGKCYSFGANMCKSTYGREAKMLTADGKWQMANGIKKNEIKRKEEKVSAKCCTHCSLWLCQCVCAKQKRRETEDATVTRYYH